MAPPDLKNSRASDSKAAIRELIRGREVAARLGALLRRGSQGGGQGEVGELAEEVMTSMSKALLALDSGETSEARQDVPAAAGESVLCSDDGKSEASTGKRKARPGGDRRAGQRRRSHSCAWTVPSKTLNDGHTWRKYGQKAIQSANFPRSYFRCTHKYDQGCQAVRQAQRSEEDPSTYLITYMGHHTCMNGAKSGQAGARRDVGDAFLISFGAPDPQLDGGVRDHPAAPPQLAPPKQEYCDEDVLSNLSRHDSSSEYLMPPELAAFETSMQVAGASGAASDIGDATSGLHSSSGVSPSSLDVDLTVESFEFEDVFNLDPDEEFDFKFAGF